MRSAFDSLHLLLNGPDIDQTSRALVTLLGAVVWADGSLDDAEIELFRSLLPDELSGRQIDALVEELRSRNDWDFQTAAKSLSGLTADEIAGIMASLVKLACYDGNCGDASRRVLTAIGQEFGVSAEDLCRQIKSELSEFAHRQRTMRSWTGIVVAVVIIGIFILTATFLKAVLFGFVLAYVFLPLSLFFYRKFSTAGIFSQVCECWKIPLLPLLRFSSRIKRKFYVSSAPASPLADADALMARNVNKAIGATAVLVIGAGLLAVLLVTTFSAYYVVGISADIKKWADQQVAEEQTRSINASNYEEERQGVRENSYLKSFVAATIRKMEDWRKKIERWPLVQEAIAKIGESLKDQENQKALAAAVLKRTGGFFSVTAGFFSHFASILFIMLMTMFFFLLFLQKMALYSVRLGKREELGRYVIKSIFSSKWMPYTGPETREQAQRILDDISVMLRTWLKGYMTIIAIESTIYTTLFTLLGVPYSLILGIIAGSTVLLPYIGPIISISLTLIVTMAVGAHTSVVIMLAILLVYLVVCGILDQFVLYPALVGEALGLTTIETIIVVLLGGMFAGLPGMIFAVPTASVIKYLIPQIYRCWQTPAESSVAQG